MCSGIVIIEIGFQPMPFGSCVAVHQAYRTSALPAIAVYPSVHFRTLINDRSRHFGVIARMLSCAVRTYSSYAPYTVPKIAKNTPSLYNPARNVLTPVLSCNAVKNTTW